MIVSTYLSQSLKTPTGSGLSGDCVEKDAMPGGGGAWTDPDYKHIWAPSISYFSGKWWLHYTATKNGTSSNGFDPGQRCLGRASSNSPTGPFTGKQEVACPGGGRWAIDPDVLVINGEAYMTYRDDAITTGNQTGISGVKLKSNGHANWPTRRDLLKSTDVGNSSFIGDYDFVHSNGKHIIENPSMFYDYGTGHYTLAFSAGRWDSRNYTTGLANCGTSPLPTPRCKVITATEIGTDYPFWGHSGSHHKPFKQLHNDKPGPGGMNFYYRPGAGSNWGVSWHWWTGSGRKIRKGYLTGSGIGMGIVTK